MTSFEITPRLEAPIFQPNNLARGYSSAQFYINYQYQPTSMDFHKLSEFVIMENLVFFWGKYIPTHYWSWFHKDDKRQPVQD